MTRWKSVIGTAVACLSLMGCGSRSDVVSDGTGDGRADPTEDDDDGGEDDPEICGSGSLQVTCAAGQYCCNASCGICAADGESCISLACEEN